MNKALDLLHGLVSEVERKTCCHEETHRGGAIWEICDSCGAKWADDEGGKPEFAWPESVEKAREFLATHPAVEQAGGDERAAFELFVRKHCGMPAHIAVNWDAKFTNDAWEGWQARAALAQPSPAQAEAERPEVVATMYVPNEKVHDDIGFKAFVIVGNCDKDGGGFYDPEKLMTVAQHERIVGELRAVITQLRQHKNDYMDAGRETYRALQNEIREREAEIARLDGLVSVRTAERDAALARVAGLELGIARIAGDFLPDNSGQAELALDEMRQALHELLAAAPTQAQHSVPAAWYYDAPSQAEAAIIDIRGMWGEDDCPTYEDVASALRRLLAAAPGKEGV
ncbi:hypothetical protein L5556_000350 [Pseudomonas aeruginosa]|nr:hypothetical protein [Pseudomonas aeruginosa]